MQLLSRITIKNVTGGIKGNPEKMKALLAAGTAGIALMTIIGQTTGFKEVLKEWEDGRTQTSLKFKGSFKATNLETGEVFRSGIAFLPETAANLLSGAIGEDSKAVQFGFKISAKYDADAATQYVYVVESLMEAAENDPVELLEQALNSQKLLPAAKVAETKEAEPEAAPPAAEPEAKKGSKNKEKATA